MDEMSALDAVRESISVNEQRTTLFRQFDWEPASYVQCWDWHNN